MFTLLDLTENISATVSGSLLMCAIQLMFQDSCVTLLQSLFLSQKLGSEGVSLTTGLEYGMEQWNGKWNGMINVHSYS